MDIKEGHPGAVFHWFFVSDQGSHSQAHMLFMLYGTKADLVALSRECLSRKEEFNDVLGPEILFLFFDPSIPVHQLSEDGRALQASFERRERNRYAFTGGVAHAIPPGMIEVGQGHFRSQEPNRYFDEKLSFAAAQANSRAVPFFQQAFAIAPGQSALIFLERVSREITVFDLGAEVTISADALLRMMRSIRPMARRPNEGPYTSQIVDLVEGSVQSAALKSAVKMTWDRVVDTLKRVGDPLSFM